MLEPFGLDVDAVRRQPQRLRQVELQQPVVPQHLDGDPLTGGGQLSAVIAAVLDQAQLVELLDHRGR